MQLPEVAEAADIAFAMSASCHVDFRVNQAFKLIRRTEGNLPELCIDKINMTSGSCHVGKAVKSRFSPAAEIRPNLARARLKPRLNMALRAA